MRDAMDRDAVPVLIIPQDRFLKGQSAHLIHEKCLDMREMAHTHVKGNDRILATGKGHKDSVGYGRRRFDGTKKRKAVHLLASLSASGHPPGAIPHAATDLGCTRGAGSGRRDSHAPVDSGANVVFVHHVTVHS